MSPHQHQNHGLASLSVWTSFLEDFGMNQFILPRFDTINAFHQVYDVFCWFLLLVSEQKFKKSNGKIYWHWHCISTKVKEKSSTFKDLHSKRRRRNWNVVRSIRRLLGHSEAEVLLRWDGDSIGFWVIGKIALLQLIFLRNLGWHAMPVSFIIRFFDSWIIVLYFKSLNQIIMQMQLIISYQL